MWAVGRELVAAAVFELVHRLASGRILPFRMRSRNCRPRLCIYSLAIEITRRRLASTISLLWRCAPSRSPSHHLQRCGGIRRSKCRFPLPGTEILWRGFRDVVDVRTGKILQPLAHRFGDDFQASFGSSSRPEYCTRKSSRLTHSFRPDAADGPHWTRRAC